MNNKHIFSVLMALAVCVGGMNFVHAQSVSKPQELHLDAPVTDENSVRVDFGGAVLRVPKFLIDPKSIPADPKKPLEMRTIGFTFWYPDMTLTCYGRLCSPVDPTKTIDPNAQSDQRFKIYVTLLQYSPEDRDKQTPRPSEIFERYAHEVGYPEIVFSELDGLNIVDYSDAYKRKFPERANYKPAVASSGHLYFNKPGTSYELMMNCDGFWCRGRTYDKENHFLAQFILDRPSSGVVSNTNNLIKKFHKMIKNWSIK